MKTKLFNVFILAIFIALASFPKPAIPYPADIKDIHGRDYYSTLHEELQNAKESIVVLMYFINFDPAKKDKVWTLVNDLVEARKRGSKVTVILDRNIQFHKQRLQGKGFYVEEKNKKVFEFLKENGVDVFYDNKNVYTHGKGIVIDGIIVILGSTNWSNSSLGKNNELAVVVESKQLAEKTLDYIKTIAIDHAASSKTIVSYVKLSKEVLTGPLSELITTHNQTCWKLLIWLIGKYQPGETIDFDYDVYAKEAGITAKRERYRSNINVYLKTLNQQYNLLTFKTKRSKNAKITLKTSVKPGQRYFNVPVAFWKYGWDKRLSNEAQFCLFINFLKSGKEHKQWYSSKKVLEKEFHIGHFLISKGMLELKRWNLIDIIYSSTKEGFDKRLANNYRLKDLYSMDDFEKEVQKLEDKYGKEKVTQARIFAKILLDENNLEHIEDIILLTEQYGLNKAKYAFDKVSKYKIDNPMRSLRYVAGILKTED